MGGQDAMKDVVDRFSKGEQERRRVSVARSYAFYVICGSLGTRLKFATDFPNAVFASVRRTASNDS